MSTDHTDTPETDAAYLATLQWAARHGNDTTEQKLDAMVDDPRPPSAWTFARQLEKELTQARAALATAMEERDKAIKEAARRDEKWMMGVEEVCGRKLEWNSGFNHASALPDLYQFVDALRARNDALTKALEEKENVCELMLCESVHLILRAGMLYRFAVDKGCKECVKIANDGKFPHEPEIKFDPNARLATAFVRALNLEPKSK